LSAMTSILDQWWRTEATGSVLGGNQHRSGEAR